MTKLMPGQRIFWKYKHYLNSRTYVTKFKRGDYVCLMRHTRKHWIRPNAQQMACVHFDGNVQVSYIPESEVKTA